MPEHKGSTLPLLRYFATSLLRTLRDNNGLEPGGKAELQDPGSACGQRNRPLCQVLDELEPPLGRQANGPRPEGRRVGQRVRRNVVTDLKCRLRIKRVVDEQ